VADDIGPSGSTDAESGQGGFYVGYLGVPRRHAMFLAVAVPLAFAAVGVGAIGLSVGQPVWGDAVWDTAEPVRITGVYRSSPYPMLHERLGDGSVRTHLLVGVGKVGAGAVLSGESFSWLEGSAVTVTGWRLERDGRRILEMDLSALETGRVGSTIASADAAEVPRAGALELRGAEPVTLRGEVVDVKCFLGAMKPGRGRGHKSCATLCVRGGIPPVLYSVDAAGAPVYYLLVDETGSALRGDRLDALLPMIAEPVEISGVESRLGSWRVLRTTRGAVAPLG